MNILVNFHHTKPDPWLEEYARKKLQKVTRLLKEQSHNLTLHIDFMDPSGPNKKTIFDRGVILRMSLPKGYMIHIEETEDTFVRSINFAAVRFVRQLKRWLKLHQSVRAKRSGRRSFLERFVKH